MQRTTLEQWRMFKAVVDEGGFNQASSKNGCAHSAADPLAPALRNELEA